MTAATEQIIAALEGVIPAYDNAPPEDTPTDPIRTAYAIVYDDSGLGRRTHLDGKSKWVWYTYPVIVAARTPSVLRDAVENVRNALLDLRVLTNTSPLSELSAGAVHPSGPEGNERLSKTLTFGHRIPRSTT